MISYLPISLRNRENAMSWGPPCLLLFTIFTFLVVAAPRSLEAQDSEPAQSYPGFMEEIVVTATKLGETPLQDTPMSISAIGQEMIEYLGADQMLDYLLLVPNVSFTLATPTGGRDDPRPGRHVTIEGIDSGPDGVPTTAFYINDTHIALMDPRLFDVNRVELRRLL